MEFLCDSNAWNWNELNLGWYIDTASVRIEWFTHGVKEIDTPNESPEEREEDERKKTRSRMQIRITVNWNDIVFIAVLWVFCIIFYILIPFIFFICYCWCWCWCFILEMWTSQTDRKRRKKQRCTTFKCVDEVLTLMTTTAKALGDLLWFQLHIFIAMSGCANSLDSCEYTWIILSRTRVQNIGTSPCDHRSNSPWVQLQNYNVWWHRWMDAKNGVCRKFEN